jgi:ribosomal protein S18 acetylase RimI-like enzyme
VDIEPATPEDCDGICAVLAEGDALHVEHLPDVFRPKRAPVRPRDFLVARITGPESAILVARKGVEIVGVVDVAMKPPIVRDSMVPRRVALIDNVVVRTPYRRQGIATQLLARAEAWACERGADVTELHVWSFNVQAKTLYERMGYVARSVRLERVITDVARGSAVRVTKQ